MKTKKGRRVRVKKSERKSVEKKMTHMELLHQIVDETVAALEVSQKTAPKKKQAEKVK